MHRFDMRMLPGAARRGLRSPLAYWVAAATVAGGGAFATFSWMRHAEASAADWGSSRTVLVVSAAVARGAALDAAVTERRSIPIALVPEGAVESLESLPSSGHRVTAAVELVPGMVVTPGLVVSGPGSQLARRLGPDERAVTLEWTTATPAVEVGDVVDVHIVAPIDSTSADGFTTEPAPVVASAKVVDASAESVTVAVPSSKASDLVAASSEGRALLALVGPSG